MKKILIALLLIGIVLISCGPLRVEKLKVHFTDGSIDTITLRYRGKLTISERSDLVDNTGNRKLMNVKSYSILK